MCSSMSKPANSLNSECMTRFEGIKTLQDADAGSSVGLASECMTRFEGIKTKAAPPDRFFRPFSLNA